MKPGGKPGLVVALGLGGKSSKSPPASEPEMKAEPEADDEGDFDSAAQGVMDALKSGDVEAFKTALKLAVMSCSESEY